MKTMNVISRWLPALMLLLAAVSCTKEQPAGGRGQQQGESDVLFSLEVPASQVGTRSLTVADENNVQTIDVMLFGASTGYRYTQAASVVTSLSPTEKTFTVRLPIGTYDVVIIANGRAAIQAGNFPVGAAKTTVMTALEHTLAAGTKWTSNQIPMWGESTAVAIDASTSLTGANSIKMTRMVAKVEVQLAAAAAGSGNSNFAITSVRLYNYNTAGKMVPNLATGWDASNNMATAPHLAATPGKQKGPLVYTSADDPTATFFTAGSVTNTIYTFEASSGNVATRQQNTCVVVGGSYNGSGADTHFYRMDFVKTVGSVITFLPLLRNHRYMFTVNSITGPGFPDPDEAFTAGPVNIDAEVIEWNEAGMNNVSFDGQNVLSVSKSQINLFSEAVTAEESHNSFYVFTDYTTTPPGTSGWTVEKIVDASNNPATWLTATPTSGPANTTDKVVLTHTTNSTGSPRTATVWIAAGRLRFPITVTQSTVAMLKLEIVDSNGDPVSELVFESLADGTLNVNSASFTVRWAPQNTPVQVLNIAGSTSGGGLGATSGVPANGSYPGITAGQRSWTITPVKFSSGDIAANPFITKETKLYFTINNGAASTTQSITVRQQYNNLTIDPVDASDKSTYPNYLLDGSTRMLNIKSNVAYRIKSVATTGYNNATKAIDANGTPVLNPLSSDNLTAGTLGGYNTVPGDNCTYTLANNSANYGRMVVVVESVDMPKKFADKSITITFPLKSVKVMGLAEGGYGYSPAYNVSNGAYRMLTATANFGLTATSKVLSRGFTFSHHESGGISSSDMGNYINENPNIIVTGYSCNFSQSVVDRLSTWVNSGGVLIAALEDQGTADRVISTFFSGASAHTPGASVGDVYRISGDDLVANGPFGDLRNLQWGSDNQFETFARNYPTTGTNAAVVYSPGVGISIGTNTNRPNEAVLLRHTSKGLIFCGDAGFIGCNDTGSTVYRPFMLNSSNAPVAKNNFGGGTRYSVYNSQLFANMMVWAIGNVKN
ncbi:hypothetical protein FACS1894159_02240 [Bacteroidia bacterium]|nr:hypothetical protein FACS1894159_02240 [Bacteroidia bacterium]